MAKAKPRLGKGLAGLISGNTANKSASPAAKTAAPAKAPAKKTAEPASKAKNEATPAPVAEPLGSSDFMELPVSKVEPNSRAEVMRFENQTAF